MLPIVDYGGIAVVVPKVNAVGNTFNDNDKYNFEVYLTGMDGPIAIGFDTQEEAEDARDELIAIIAQYYFVKEFGPETAEEILDINDTDDFDKDKH